MSIRGSSGSETEILSDASIGTYKRALRKKEAVYNHATIQLANKDKQIADVTNAMQPAVPATPGSVHPQTKESKHIYIVDRNDRLEVQTAAKKFTYMNTFWLRPTDTKIFALEINPEYNPRNRYLSIEEEQQGILFDLLNGLPTKWHTRMDSQPFRSQFLHEMSQQRSNACTRLHQTGPLILGCSNDVFHDNSRRVGAFKDLIGFVVKGDGTETYNTLAPILYKEDPHQTDNKWTIFRHPILMKTYSALVRGPNSIKGLVEGQVTRQEPHVSVETKWGIKCITPGAIAMASILACQDFDNARFVGSGDKTLLTTGSETKINYQKDYEFYFQYLHKGFHSEKPSVVDIFKTWNAIFYPNFVECSNIPTPANDEDLDALLNELDAEGVEEETVGGRYEEPECGEQTLATQIETRDLSPSHHHPEPSARALRMSSPLSDSPEDNRPLPMTDVGNVIQSSHRQSHLDRPSPIHAQVPSLANKRTKRKAIQSEEEPDEQDENVSPPAKQPRRSYRSKKN